MSATIVILNGVGSAGKSSIAKALQGMTARPFLHVSMDAFFEMLPPEYFDNPESFQFVNGSEDGHPSVEIRTGPVGARLMDGMRRAIAALASAGNDLIVDDVMLGDEDQAYRRLLAPYHTHWVGIHASLAVLEERERLRGDRIIGLARWQFARVHAGKVYDLEIDTALSSAEDCARLIKERFEL